MLKVKTELRESAIAGIGLFAAEFIPKGTVIWEFDPYTDFRIAESLYEHYRHLEKYMWVNSKGEIILPLDNDKFTNHSRTPNRLHVSDTLDIAGEDIEQGTEITQDYRFLIPADLWPSWL